VDLPGLSVSASAYDRDEDCTVVSLAGRADLADAAWFRQLLALPDAPGRIILDLSRLSSIDWWAALILLWAGRMVSRRGGTLVLASPQPAVARLLRAVDAARTVTVYRSVQQARDHRRI
jgi:anti-sigma B factor antagonist